VIENDEQKLSHIILRATRRRSEPAKQATTAENNNGPRVRV